MKSPVRQPSENEEDFVAMLSVAEHADQYAVAPWYGASDQDLVAAAASRGAPESELKEWSDARRTLA